STDFCDIDADGDYDLFIGDLFNATVWFFRNDGNAAHHSFTYVTDNLTGVSVGESSSPELVDIDGDGDYDLFVGREPDSSVDDAGDVFFFENIGTPTQYQFELVTRNYLSIDDGTVAHFDLIDIDADGDLDLFMTADYVLRLYRNVGTPTAPAFSKEGESYQSISTNDQYPHFCDIDADGDYDLFCGEGAIPGPPGLHLYLNQGTPDSADFILFSEDFVPWSYWVIIYPTLADIDADHDLDLFICDQDGSFYFFENTGDRYWPNFEWQSDNWQGIDPGITQRCCTFFDQDDDGDLDLLFNQQEAPQFYRNTGTAQNANMVYDPTMLLPGVNYAVMAPLFAFDMVDIDSDGDSDFFGSNNKGGIIFFRNVSDLSILEPRLTLDPLHGIQFSIGPNPANPVTWISYNLPYPQKAEIAVYNLLGQKVATLASGLQMPGEQILIWDAANYSSGQYFIKLETPSNSALQTVTVVK
ncbi:T9SS type A sorting domain-containing protein, partial [bacterium]|nr:T9SS type A sorting domain-containing protein [bacterium]